MSMVPVEQKSELRAALLSLKPVFKKAMFFSVFTNLLVLAPTIYMLEVYDRVVNSRSYMTLLMESVLVIVAYIVMEVLEWVRVRLLQQAALQFDQKTANRSFDAMFEANLRRIPGATSQVLTDLRTLREFISNPAVLAIMDVPLSLLYAVAIFVINPTMGWMSIGGALILGVVAWLTERDTQPPLTAANRSAIDAQNYANGSLRNAQVIEAMGMQKNIHARWVKKQEDFLIKQAEASDKAGGFSAVTKFVQLAQSSLLLGLGCWLTIKGEFPGGGGMMLVASILGGKVVGPIAQVIAAWKNVVSARDSYGRLDKLLQIVPARDPGMPLPAPKGLLTVEAVTAGAPGSPMAILKNVSFGVPPGKALAVVGPSASGKTTLARMLTGIWPTASGKVRLDGVDIYQWHKSELGPHVGYLPQEVELFDGSIAENIARFGTVDQALVEAAARAVGLHETILALPDGYESTIGDDGCFLSGGQRQRVGLARAIYGNPKFIVLDEPNSSLDEAGEVALVQTILSLKAQGATVIVITHRSNVLVAVDLMLILQDGQVTAFGPRDEVLSALQQRAQAAQQQALAQQQSALQPAAAGAA